MRKLLTKNNILRFSSLLCFVLLGVMLALSVVEGLAARAPSTPGIFGDTSVSSLYKDSSGTLVGGDDGCVTLFSADGEKIWNFSRADSSGSAPVVRDVALHGGKAYAAFGDRTVAVLDIAGGSVSAFFTVGLEPQRLYFGSGDTFAVFCDTNRTQSVYLLSPSDGGTQSEPVRYDRTRTLDRNRGLGDGFVSMLMRGDSVFICSDNSSVYEVDASGAVTADSVTEVWRGDGDLLALRETSGGFSALSEDGRVISFDSDFRETGASETVGTLVSARVSGDIFVAKRKNGGIIGLSESGGELFDIKTEADSLLIYASDESFAYLTEDGGRLLFIETENAVRMDRAATLFPLFTVLAAVCLIACVFTVLCGFDATREALARFFKALGKALCKHKFAYLSLVPTFALLALFYYYPIVWGFGLSFFDYKVGESATFVGLANIIAVVKNTAFWKSFLNMFAFLVTDLIKALVPPIIFAECILSVRSKKFSFWVRALLFIPGILPGVAGTLVWAEGVFGAGSSGLLNSVLKAVFPSFVTQSWLQQESTALTSLICFGFPWIGSYLIFYGAIQGIPESMYEAAKLDGCGRLRRVFSFDLPLILPQIKYVLISGFIASVQDYGRIYITTRGDFGTNTPSLMMYLAITEQKSYGIASAMSLFIFAFLAVATVLNFRMQSNKTGEES